jgi:hypothetical protein
LAYDGRCERYEWYRGEEPSTFILIERALRCWRGFLNGEVKDPGGPTLRMYAKRRGSLIASVCSRA